MREPASPRTGGASAGTIVLLAVASFTSSAALRVCDALLPRLAQEFQRSPGEASHVVTGFALAYGLLQLVFGPLGDRYGKMRLICLGLYACALTSVISALAFDFPTLVAARMLWGAAAAGIIPLAMAWIGDAMPYHERQATLARLMLGTLTGMIAGQLVGGVFAGLAMGWRGAFALFTVAYVVTGVLLARQTARLGAAVAPASQAQSEAGAGFLGKLAAVLAVPWARVVLLAVFLEGLFLLGPIAYIPTFLHDTLGISLVLAAALTAFYAVGGLVYALNARRIVRRLGERRMVANGGVLAGVGFLMWLLLPHWAGAGLAAFVLGFGTYLFHNTLQTHATQMAPAMRGTAVSAFAFSLFVGQALGVALTGHLVDRVGFVWPLALPVVVLPLTGWGFAWALRRRR